MTFHYLGVEVTSIRNIFKEVTTQTNTAGKQSVYGKYGRTDTSPWKADDHT